MVEVVDGDGVRSDVRTMHANRDDAERRFWSVLCSLEDPAGRVRLIDLATDTILYDFGSEEIASADYLGVA